MHEDSCFLGHDAVAISQKTGNFVSTALENLKSRKKCTLYKGKAELVP
jgi:hypothetical protein